MNKTVLIVVIIVAVIVVALGGYAVLNKNKSVETNTTEINMTNQTQTPTTTASPTQTAGKNEVTIQNFAFSPATITIKVGDSITWTNKDSIGHSATADDKNFDTGVLSQGESKSITFTKGGVFKYHCSVHPNMHGEVVVN